MRELNFYISDEDMDRLFPATPRFNEEGELLNRDAYRG